MWEILGIEPTTDEGAIRKAYARELKLHRPDKDPQGYQQLREAFDEARRYANDAADTARGYAQDAAKTARSYANEAADTASRAGQQAVNDINSRVDRM